MNLNYSIIVHSRHEEDKGKEIYIAVDEIIAFRDQLIMLKHFGCFDVEEDASAIADLIADVTPCPEEIRATEKEIMNDQVLLFLAKKLIKEM